MMGTLGARALLGVLWLFQHLPLAVQAALGRGLGAVLYRMAGSRRRIALRNVALCLPELDADARRRLVRDHFGWLARSLLERGLLWYASAERLKTLIHVEGDVGLAERSDKPVMWLVPHFLALDVAGVSALLFQTRHAVSMYQAQSNPVFDAAMRAGRLRFGNAAIFARSERALPLVRLRALLRGAGGHLAGAGAHGAQPGHAGAAGGGRTAARRRRLPGALPAADRRLSGRRRRSRRTGDEPLDRGRDPPQSGAVPAGAQALQDSAGGRSLAVRPPGRIIVACK